MLELQEWVLIALAMFGVIFLALCFGSGLMFFSRLWSGAYRAPKERVVRRGDRVFVEMFWTDERGAMSKRRDYTVWTVLKSHWGRNDHVVQLVGNEEEDRQMRKDMGVE